MAIHVFVHDDAVDIELTGLDRLEAMKKHLRVPMALITDARVADTAELAAERTWRFGATHLPGLVAAGQFGTPDRKGVRQLWAVHRDPQVLLIETRLEEAWRIVLQHPDRDRLAWLIAERIAP